MLIHPIKYHYDKGTFCVYTNFLKYIYYVCISNKYH